MEYLYYIIGNVYSAEYLCLAPPLKPETRVYALFSWKKNAPQLRGSSSKGRSGSKRAWDNVGHKVPVKSFEGALFMYRATSERCKVKALNVRLVSSTSFKKIAVSTLAVKARTVNGVTWKTFYLSSEYAICEFTLEFDEFSQVEEVVVAKLGKEFDTKVPLIGVTLPPPKKIKAKLSTIHI